MQNEYILQEIAQRKGPFFSVVRKKNVLFNKTLFLLIGVFFCFFNTFSISEAHGEESGRTLKEKALTAIEFKREYLAHVIDQQERLVMSLVESPLMKEYLSTNTKLNKDNLEQLFLTVSDVNNDYMQVRFIDASGKEKIRIDHPKSATVPTLISKDDLQDKSNRGYFKQVKKMVNGGLWHSPLDLNVEQGVIEEVINPTFRVASPVYLDGKFSGMVIINLEMSPVISHLLNSTDFKVYLVDADNEFLVHPDASKAWSRYLPKRGKYQETEDNNTDVYMHSLEDIFKNGEEIRLILEPISETEKPTE